MIRAVGRFSTVRRLPSRSSLRIARCFSESGKPPAAEPQYSQNRGPVSWASLGLCAVAAASATAYYNIQREKRLEAAMGQIVTTGKLAVGGPWSLVDLDGNLVTNKQFEGKWLLLYFGFARCPDICPSEMVKLGKIMDNLQKEHPDLRPQILPVFVSVDPGRDSLKALRKYAQDFHPSFVFLTGSPNQVDTMAKAYRVYFSKADETEDGDYLVDHSIVTYIHNPQGEVVDCLTQSMRPTDGYKKIVRFMKAAQTLKQAAAT